MTIEASIDIGASADTVFALYADVPHWCEWDPDTKASSIDGEFAAGATGRLKPTQGFEVPMVLSSVVPGRSFTVTSRVPLGTIYFEHELEPNGHGVRATHRVTFSGPLRGLYARLVGPRVQQGLPRTMQRLKQAAEAKKAQATA